MAHIAEFIPALKTAWVANSTLNAYRVFRKERFPSDNTNSLPYVIVNDRASRLLGETNGKNSAGNERGTEQWRHLITLEIYAATPEAVETAMLAIDGQIRTTTFAAAINTALGSGKNVIGHRQVDTEVIKPDENIFRGAVSFQFDTERPRGA